MDMQNAKEMLEKIYKACDLADELGVTNAKLDRPLRDVFRLDVCRFFVYLAASDRTIAPAEAEYINGLFDVDYTVEEYDNLMHASNIYSVNYDNDMPVSMLILAFFDVKLDEYGKQTGESYPNLIPLVLDFYLEAGKGFISCDKEVTDQEIEDLAVYVAKKKAILENIVETEKFEDVVK